MQKKDESCSKHFKYSDIIMCGSTQQKYSDQIENIPQNEETWNAIQALALNILDPIVEHFGEIELTHGFTVGRLANKVRKEVGRVAPDLDQHCGYELNTKGKPICKNPGQSVDFKVLNRKVDSLEVALWCFDHLDFDSLYFYGVSRPLHISYGPKNRKSVTALNRSKGKKPHPIKINNRESLANIQEKLN